MDFTMIRNAPFIFHDICIFGFVKSHQLAFHPFVSNPGYAHVSFQESLSERSIDSFL